MKEIKDKVLVKAKDGVAPQYFNDASGEFEVVTGIAGKLATHDSGVINAINQLGGSVVIDSFSSVGEVSKRYPRGANGLTIVNDGETAVVATVDTIKVEVKESEVFSDTFSTFTSLYIKGGDYRVIVKGVK